jgi:hypothetical protein
VTSRLTRCRQFPLLYLLVAACCVWPPSLRAQKAGPRPIRVETREVYVPVLVLDKSRIVQLQEMKPSEYGQELVANTLDFGAVAVRDLNARDFQLSEDGQEQKIENVASGFQLPRPIQDNLGLSQDFVGAGGGVWIAPGPSRDYHDGMEVNVPDWPGYLIAYVSPRASDGHCHQVAVKVDRPDSLIFGRTEYCNTSDPLKGTDLGKRMESDLTSGKKGTIGLSLEAADLFTNTQTTRVQISVEFSPNRISRTGKDCSGLPEIRILGMIYAKDGTLAARFSDFMSRNFSPRGQAMPLLLPTSRGPISCVADGPSYQKQIHLAPGEYNLQVALMDGKDFGRTSIPFVVEGYDKQHLAASGIALVRRFRDVRVGLLRTHTDLPVDYIRLLSQGLEFMPTANAYFEGAMRLGYYFEVFEPPSVQPPVLTVQVHLRILDAESGAVKIDLPAFSAEPYTIAGDPVIPIGGKIDVSELPSGSYRLEVQATDSAGQSTPWRTVNFIAQ